MAKAQQSKYIGSNLKLKFKKSRQNSEKPNNKGIEVHRNVIRPRASCNSRIEAPV
jgi:hypothetical protein